MPNPFEGCLLASVVLVAFLLLVIYGTALVASLWGWWAVLVPVVLLAVFVLSISSICRGPVDSGR